MTTFLNQTIGSHDDKSYEYVSVWFDEKIVKGFSSSVITKDVMGNGHMIYGMSVDARNVWQAVAGFNTEPNMAIHAKGYEFFCVLVWLPDGKTREIRMSSKYGPAIARMVKTGYIQYEDQKEYAGMILTTNNDPSRPFTQADAVLLKTCDDVVDYREAGWHCVVGYKNGRRLVHAHFANDAQARYIMTGEAPKSDWGVL